MNEDVEPQTADYLGPIPDAERTRYHFFARLASVSTYDSLVTHQRWMLLRDFVLTFFKGDGNTERTLKELLGTKPIEELGVNQALKRLHRESRDLLYPLLKGESVSPNLSVKAPQIVWRLENGQLRQEWEALDRIDDVADSPPYWFEILRWELLRAVQFSPFPYALCPVCDRVFVTFGNARQRYCSASCSHRGSVDARREAKNAYMRQYMSERGSPPRKGARSRSSAKLSKARK